MDPAHGESRAARPAHVGRTGQGLSSIHHPGQRPGRPARQRNAAGNMLQGLRHIFRPLKRRRIIFTDPTTRIFCGMPTATIPLPVEVTNLRQVLQDQAAPKAALSALVIFHALTFKELRTVLTTDLCDGRLFLPNRTVLLAEAVRDRLTAYLDYRNSRWPRTANSHLFLSQTTACGVEPVSNVWINDVLGMPARRLREDRLLHEAEATGGDPRRICDLFGLTVGAALRYTSTVNQTGLVEYNLRNAGHTREHEPMTADLGACCRSETGPSSVGSVLVQLPPPDKYTVTASAARRRRTHQGQARRPTGFRLRLAEPIRGHLAGGAVIRSMPG
ncbi:MULTISPECIES: hypothetical protein [unclassified Streptomyces]|uniref:hypothetical protein n=1 Tax=unclassified Streptomyces TaxID=2593676 RepID=UPI00336A7522